jgi:hypothetical protein
MTRQVIVNRVRLTDAEVRALEDRYRVRIPDGAYWYDRMCGAWGYEGGPQVGIAVAGIDVGGALRADSSNGDTGVFINGRELHRNDVLALMQLGPVYRGRWWVDALGNCGPEGGPAWVNLVALARLKMAGQGSNTRNGSTWTFSDGQGFIGVQFRDSSGRSMSVTN